MSGQKSAYHHGDLRNALIREAEKLVRAEGADAFSLRSVARSVGVSANAAYRHFSDRSELLAAVAARASVSLTRFMRREQAAADEAGTREERAVERFKATGRAYVKFALRHPEMFRLLFSGGAGVNGGIEGVAAEDTDSQSPYDLLSLALDDLLDTGMVSARSRADGELKAWSLVHGHATLLLSGALTLSSRSEQDRALEGLLDFAMAGLEARPHPHGTH